MELFTVYPNIGALIARMSGKNLIFGWADYSEENNVINEEQLKRHCNSKLNNYWVTQRALANSGSHQLLKYFISSFVKEAMIKFRGSNL